MGLVQFRCLSLVCLALLLLCAHIEGLSRRRERPQPQFVKPLSKLLSLWEDCSSRIERHRRSSTSTTTIKTGRCGNPDIPIAKKDSVAAAPSSQVDMSDVTIVLKEQAGNLFLSFEAFGTDLTLKLTPDTSLLSPKYAEAVFMRKGHYKRTASWTDAAKFLSTCHFEGTANSATAKVSLCDPNKAFVSLLTETFHYLIKPVASLIGNNTATQQQPRTPSQTEFILATPHSIIRKPINLRKRQANPTFKINAFVVSDQNRTTKFEPEVVAQLTLQQASIASTYYMNSDFPANTISLTVAGQLLFQEEYLQQFNTFTYRECSTVDPTTNQVGCFNGSGSVISTASFEVDVDRLLTSVDIFTNQDISSIEQEFGPIDQISLFSGSDFSADTVGLAPVGAICTSNRGTAIIQAFDGLIAYTASIFAHEVGHNLGFQHDPGTGFIMSASSGPQDNFTTFSPQSIATFQQNQAQNAYQCLSDSINSPPSASFCGNGILEQGEQCDAGFFTDPCCNTTSCQLLQGCECANFETCCNSGHVVSAGTTCRPAINTCDEDDSCKGGSGICYDIVKGPDVTCTDLGNNPSSCFQGNCLPSRTYQCRNINAAEDLSSDTAAEGHNNCDVLFCNHNGDVIFWPTVPVQDGTPCGNSTGGVCVSAQCLPLQFGWQTGNPNPTCSGGTRLQDVWCAATAGNIQYNVDDSYCSGSGQKPSNTVPC